jgi:hypothetical protein
MGYKCPVCEKLRADTMDLARHVFGTGDQAHKDWVDSKGLNFIELLLIQTMEPGNKGYKTLANLLKKEAEKVEDES